MTSTTSEAPRFAFNPDALREKYRQERDKRLQPHGVSQFIDLAGEFAGFADDPWADPNFSREAIDDEIDVLILGGGITGLMTGAALKKSGIDNVRIVDKAGDFGGTWYWNRYPGIRCDVESYIYMPLLEDLGYMPSEKYSKGSEILAHLKAVGRHFGLYDKALFQTQVKRVEWNDATARWNVTTDRGDTLKARFIALSTGPISKPKLPGIRGIRDFKGHAFHTARWDYDYTKGNQDGGLTGLADKRVAIIGTGATGVQVVPLVAAHAKETIVVQRTPAAVDFRANRPTDYAWAETLESGWQKRRMENFSAILMGMPVEEDLVADRWTDIWGRLSKWSGSEGAKAEAGDDNPMQLADFQKMEEIRARIDDVVEDPATAAKLKPWYNLFCKRPLYSDEYLQAFNRPSVTLIDTGGRSVERITEDALIIDGVEYPVDCIVFASGYDIAVPAFKAGDFEIVGRDGVTLEDKWAGGMRTLHGMLVDQFPNMFVIGTIKQAAASINFPHMLGEQASYTADVIKRTLDSGGKAFEVQPEVVDAWLQALKDNAVDMSEFEADCTPSYLNNEGDKSAGLSLFGATYGAGIFAYLELCEDWRANRFERDVVLTR